MELTHIADYLERNARDYPEKTALVYEDESRTWLDLFSEVEAVSKYLSTHLSHGRQEVVALLLANTPEFIILHLAILRAGHIVMPLDPNFKQLEVQAVVERMEPQIIITDGAREKLFKKSDGVLLAESVLQDAKLSDSGIEPLRLPADAQVATMLFTSGTTGNPKAVPYTHRNHLWNIEAVSSLWQWEEDDTVLLSLPLSHWHGLVMVLDGALYHGNTIYLQSWFDADDTLRMLESGKVSLFMHVPIAYSKLITHNPDHVYDISGVRLCISGSSFLPPKLWKQFNDRFNQPILERYGANEMGLLASNQLEERKPGSVGYVLPDVDIKIMPDGEIAMRSPGLFPGYWNNDEATAKQRLEDGYWLSGDIGEVDDAGRLWLKGRIQEKMKKAGYTVYPRDVEWALMQHDDISEVVVMSIQKDDELSDEFVYFVVGSTTEQQIRDFCKETMPFFWRPDTIKLLDEIPKTGRTSKPALKELRAMIAEKS